MIVGFIDEHREEFGVEPICRVLQMAPSTYYAAKKRVGLDATLGDTIRRVAQADLRGAASAVNNPDPVVAPLANTDEVAVLAVPSGLVGLDRVSGTPLWSSAADVRSSSTMVRGGVPARRVRCRSRPGTRSR